MKAKDWWALIERDLEDVRQMGPDRYQAICFLHRGTHPSLSIDLGKANGVWYCHGDCKRGGSLQGLAIEFGWVEMEDGPVRMDWLEPPYEYLQVEPDAPLTLRVIRYEVGLSKRPIEEPPGFVSHVTIRFHVPPDDKTDGPPYYDFTNLTLIIATVDVYSDLVRRLRDERDRLHPVGPGSSPEELAGTILEFERINAELERINAAYRAILPEHEDAFLTFQLTRHGRGRDTRYEVKVLDVWPLATQPGD